MLHPRAVCCALMLALVALGCGALGSTGAGPQFRGKEVRPDEFTLILLRTGDLLPSAPDARIKRTMEEHYEFMDRLAADGSLLVAGPFGNDKAATDLRGLFVLDGASVDISTTLAAQDPMTSGGFFRQEAYPLIALDFIRWLPEMSLELDAERARAGQDPSNPVLGDFVVMIARDGKAAFAACTHEALASKVVLLGRVGGALDGALFGIFDATDPGEIRARLTVAGMEMGADPVQGEGLELSQWMATPALRRLSQGD